MGIIPRYSILYLDSAEEKIGLFWEEIC